MVENSVVLIPALNPDKRLIDLINELKGFGLHKIIVINDGSDSSFNRIFDEAEGLCIVERHIKNKGKGAAIKTGIKSALEHYGTGISCILADADGQHLPQDIAHIAAVSAENPDSLVLGVRDFSLECVPWRSKMGNRITSVFFKTVSGVSCPDTQTGLRGIPPSLVKHALSCEGERYEYEMNFLMDAVKQVPLKYVPIQTVYEDNNPTSHFRPVRDSVRVYGRFLRFAAASLSGAAADFMLFFAFLHITALVTGYPHVRLVFAATVSARICSGIVNFMLNKYWSFKSGMPIGREMLRYIILFAAQMLASGTIVSLLALTAIPLFAAKILTDTVLFFISYRIQNNWVFRQEAV